MSEYTSPLVWKKLKEVSGRKLGMTLESFSFWFEYKGNTYWVDVPKGTKFNGASIPYLIQKLFNWYPFDHRWIKASVIHDILVNELGYQGVIRQDMGYGARGIPIVVTWEFAAFIFNEALIVKQDQYYCPDFNRKAFISAVKFWGYLNCKN